VHDERQPVHVTLRAGRRLPSLRKQSIFVALRRALARTSREWFRVVQFSVQTDHVHLVVEATDKMALSRGMAVFRYVSREPSTASSGAKEMCSPIVSIHARSPLRARTTTFRFGRLAPGSAARDGDDMD
jgi:hypothetical protein